MANIRAFVGRRKAIGNIRKITRTMELVATARFRKALGRATGAKAYTRTIAELAASLCAAVQNVTHPLLERRAEVKSRLLLVISANRGLCGGYNADVLREATARIRETKAEGAVLHLEVSGKRGITYFRYLGVRAEQTFTQFEDRPRYEDVEALVNRYLEFFIGGKIDRLDVAYMKFQSAARQVPVVETLLPLAGPTLPVTPRRGGEQAAPPAHPVEYEFLPSAGDILKELLPESCKVRLFQCFLDAAVSEQIARRVSMKAATDNIDEMTQDLTREYNRARQDQITKEIAEVIGGAAALE
jgi:F-type H+-transporting ATPase subunit gamma